MLDRKMTPSDSFQEEIFNETIIEEIGKYPCLYNSEDAKFGGSFGSIWQDIAAVVDSTVTHCKLRWQELLQKYEQERLNSVELISDWVHFQSIDQMLQHGIVKVCRNFDESDSIAQKKQICRTCLKVADLCNTYHIFETENLYTPT
ncbi:uncharacterized protein LOC106092551 [Stomoxys calcitrans]|uniref:uncharacterized protein LOC106092551 n=1 Tax=Stomoxys calcitrans TaxID=35570 RepID=UPI0027E33B12|nr:uncharacterized protein LOC106092551 [Stomoxys calcitrans]